MHEEARRLVGRARVQREVQDWVDHSVIRVCSGWVMRYAGRTVRARMTLNEPRPSRSLGGDELSLICSRERGGPPARPPRPLPRTAGSGRTPLPNPPFH